MAADSILETTAIKVVVDDKGVDASLKAAIARVQAAASKKKVKVGVAIDAAATATIKQHTAAIKADTTEQDKLSSAIARLRNRSLALRNEYEAGVITQKQVVAQSKQLQESSLKLAGGLDKASTQYNQLLTVAGRASRTMATAEGRMTKLGFSANASVGILGALSHQMGSFGPVGMVFAAGMQKVANAARAAATTSAASAESAAATTAAANAATAASATTTAATVKAAGTVAATGFTDLAVRAETAAVTSKSLDLVLASTAKSELAVAAGSKVAAGGLGELAVSTRAAAVASTNLDLVLFKPPTAIAVQSAGATASTAMHGVTTSFNEAGVAARGLTVALATTVAVVAGIGLAGAALLRTGIPQVKQFQAALQVLVASGEDFTNSSLTEALDSIAAAAGKAGTQFTRADIATALAEIVKAGVSAADAMNLLVPGLQLAAVTGDSLNDTTARLLTNLRQFGLGSEDAIRAADSLAKADLAAAHGAKELSTGLATVGPIAHAAGLSLEDTLGILVELDNKGLNPADVGATALRSTLTSLLDPSAKARTALDGLGVSLKNTDGTSRPLLDVLNDLQRALKDSGDGASDAAQIFNVRAVTAILNMSDASSEMADSLDNANGALGAYQDTVLSSNMQAAQTAMTNAFKDLSETFTLKFADNIVLAADALAEFLTQVDALMSSKNFMSMLGILDPAYEGWSNMSPAEKANTIIGLRVFTVPPKPANPRVSSGGGGGSGGGGSSSGGSGGRAGSLGGPGAAEITPTFAAAVTQARALSKALDAAVASGKPEVWDTATKAVRAFKDASELNADAWSAVAATTTRVTATARKAAEADVRTVQNIFDDLLAKGNHAMLAAQVQGDTAAAHVESAHARIKLVDAALRELLARPDVGEGTNPDKVSYLLGRAKELTSELKDAQAAVDVLATRKSYGTVILPKLLDLVAERRAGDKAEGGAAYPSTLNRADLEASLQAAAKKRADAMQRAYDTNIKPKLLDLVAQRRADDKSFGGAAYPSTLSRSDLEARLAAEAKKRADARQKAYDTVTKPAMIHWAALRRADDKLQGGAEFPATLSRSDLEERLAAAAKKRADAQQKAYDTVTRPKMLDLVAKRRADDKAEGGAAYPTTLNRADLEARLAAEAKKRADAQQKVYDTVIKQKMLDLVAQRRADDKAFGGEAYPSTLSRSDLETRLAAEAKKDADALQKVYIAVTRPAMEKIAAQRRADEDAMGGAAYPRTVRGPDDLAFFMQATTVDQAQTRINALQASMNALYKQGVDPASESFQKLTDSVGALRLKMAALDLQANGARNISDSSRAALTANGVIGPAVTGSRSPEGLRQYMAARQAERAAGEGPQLNVAADILAGKVEQAGLTFISQVEQAGQGFIGAVKSFQSGDVGGGIAGLGSTVGGILSIFNPVAGAAVGAGAGLLGSLIGLGSAPTARAAPLGGLFGTQRQSLTNPDIALAIGTSQAGLGPAIGTTIQDAGMLFDSAASRFDGSVDKLGKVIASALTVQQRDFALSDALR